MEGTELAIKGTGFSSSMRCAVLIAVNKRSHLLETTFIFVIPALSQRLEMVLEYDQWAIGTSDCA